VAVYVHYGFSITPGTTRDWTEVDVTLTGAAGDIGTGDAVAFLGDLNGDGFGELAVGAGGWGEYDGAIWVAGSSWLLTPGTYDLSTAPTAILGSSSAYRLGISLADAGDIDGDGVTDLLVGHGQATLSADWSGGAHLFYGAALASPGVLSEADAAFTFAGEGYNVQAGEQVARAGDIDGDGTPDLLVGARSAWSGNASTGRAYVVLSQP
jgi:hypothetical protein